MSVKLLGFAAVAEVTDHGAFAVAIRRELEAARALLGSNMVAVSCVNTDSDLTFLRACIELRIPTIVLLDDEGSALRKNDPGKSRLLENLLSVSLAKYPLYQSSESLPILEWADALLCACNETEDEVITDAQALGIPTRKLDLMSLEAKWNHAPNPESPTRHGFPTRRELLEFLDKRLGIQSEKR